mmetsp:Transcript_113803/g.328651  ORF Transcript_113803/g.328651 Transcript_113803/m.328651 type:complete len:231 (+) Transcript_113803:1563-2255(+)
MVLLRVEQLQHSARWVEHGIAGQLVDLVEQDYRVVDLQGHQRLDDRTRHAADVGTPMSPQLCFVPHTAKSDTVKFPTKCPSHRAAQRGLADAGRAMQTENRALHIPAHLLHCKEFQDATLHFVESVVVLFKDIESFPEVKVAVCARRPRQLRERLQVCPGDIVLRMLWLDVLQPAQLPLRDLLRVGGKLRLPQRLLQCRDLVLLLVTLLLRLLEVLADLLAVAVGLPPLS